MCHRTVTWLSFEKFESYLPIMWFPQQKPHFLHKNCASQFPVVSSATCYSIPSSYLYSPFHFNGPPLFLSWSGHFMSLSISFIRHENLPMLLLHWRHQQRRFDSIFRAGSKGEVCSGLSVISAHRQPLQEPAPDPFNLHHDRSRWGLQELQNEEPLLRIGSRIPLRPLLGMLEKSAYSSAIAPKFWQLISREIRFTSFRALCPSVLWKKSASIYVNCWHLLQAAFDNNCFTTALFW